MDEIEGGKDEEVPNKRSGKFGKFGKDPTVDTTFLPDKDREEADRIEKERLKSEWIAEQERIKEEIIEVTYSYWDGSGHRRTLKCSKGKKESGERERGEEEGE